MNFVTTQQILKTLPSLTPKQRRQISNRILELEEDRDTLRFATLAAEAAFLELDEMKKKNARTPTRRRVDR